MDEKDLSCLLDPVKGKILLEINYLQQVSVKQLCERCADIPRSTMYRHLGRLEKDGFVRVVAQTQKRGTVEKTYALAPEKFVPPTAAEQNDPQYAVTLFVQFCMTFIRLFQEAAAQPGFRFDRSSSVFAAAPVYATDEELRHFVALYSTAVEELVRHDAGHGRAARTVGLIITPPAVR